MEKEVVRAEPDDRGPFIGDADIADDCDGRRSEEPPRPKLWDESLLLLLGSNLPIPPKSR